MEDGRRGKRLEGWKVAREQQLRWAGKCVRQGRKQTLRGGRNVTSTHHSSNLEELVFGSMQLAIIGMCHDVLTAIRPL